MNPPTVPSVQSAAGGSESRDGVGSKKEWSVRSKGHALSHGPGHCSHWAGSWYLSNQGAVSYTSVPNRRAIFCLAPLTVLILCLVNNDSLSPLLTIRGSVQTVSFFLNNGFIEIWSLYHKIHCFKVYNPVGFSIITEIHTIPLLSN